jgi:hypothetical protein
MPATVVHSVECVTSDTTSSTYSHIPLEYPYPLAIYDNFPVSFNTKETNKLICGNNTSQDLRTQPWRGRGGNT